MSTPRWWQHWPFSDRGTGPKKGAEDGFQEVSDSQPFNPFSEAKLLTGHTDTVHQIRLLDDKRVISVSCDRTAIVWDAETGRKLYSLTGHTDVITCALAIKDHNSDECHVVMTASLDFSIRLWDLNADERYEEGFSQREITEHGGVVMCLSQLSHEMVCSGGKDVCLWDRNGRLLSKYNRSLFAKEDSSMVHSVLKLDSRHFGIVAASNYPCLAVFDIKTTTMTDVNRYSLQFVRFLSNSHRENITCISSISGNFFASGSQDGVILLWSTNTLNAMKMFDCSRQMTVAPPTKEPGSVVPQNCTEIRNIIVVAERFLFTSMGCGFKIFDVIGYEDSHGLPRPLASHAYAHQQPITCMEYLRSSSTLVTASEDGSIRLWGSPNRISGRETDDTSDHVNKGKSTIEEFLGTDLNPKGKRRPLPATPSLLGQLLVHSKSIKVEIRKIYMPHN